MEANLNWLHKESDMLTGRVDDPTVQRPLHHPKSVNRFPNHSPAMKNAYSQSSSAARRVVARIATWAKTEAQRLRSPSGRVFAGPGKVVWFAYRKGSAPQPHLDAAGQCRCPGFNKLYRNSLITDAANWVNASGKTTMCTFIPRQY